MPGISPEPLKRFQNYIINEVKPWRNSFKIKFANSLLIFFFNIILILIFPKVVNAEKIFSPVSIASGKALYLPLIPEENPLYMGSSLGSLENFGFYGGYNPLPNENEFWGSVFIPYSIGVFGISYEHHSSIISEKYSGGMMQFGFGKSLTKNLQFGFLLNFSYSDLINFKSSIGIEPSIIYMEKMHTKARNVQWIHDIFIYSAIRNLDLQIQNDVNHPQPALHFGIGSSLLKIDDFQTIFQVESSVTEAFNEIPVSFILNFQYKMLQLRGAYLYHIPINLQTAEKNDFSVGAGIRLPIGGVTILAQYGLTGLLKGDLEHYFAVGSTFNSIDQTAPLVKVFPEYDHFSPNSDGKQDEIVFLIHVKEKSPIVDWRMDIKNESGEIVRSFKKDLRERSIYFPVYKIITDLFKGGEYNYIPEQIIWDGTSNRLDRIVATTINPGSIDVPDGNYFYEMIITDIHGLKSSPERGSVILDRKAPNIALKRDFAGENSNYGIVFSVFQTFQGESDDHFRGLIINAAGKIVKNYIWNTPKDLPQRLVWDGKNNQGEFVKDGVYTYKLIATDKSGNQKTEILPKIHMFSVNPASFIETDVQGFSPNDDKSFDQIKFSLSTEMKNFEKWRVIVTRTPIRNYKNIQPVFSWQGEYNNFQTSLVWDGKDFAGNIAPDGAYFFTLLITDRFGITSQSLPEKIILDTSPPEVSITSDKAVFSPDGDGVDDAICLYSKVQDLSAIKSYKVTIYEIVYFNGKIAKIPFKKWESESSVPGKLNLDGTSDNGLDMASLHSYEFDIWISDIYGNTLQKTGGKFFTDVLVKNEGKFLKITLNDMSYSDTDKVKSFDKLNRVLSVLIHDYPDYRIRVEGHAGSPGDEETNLKKSENWARSTMAFFVASGLPRDRIGYQGYGEVIPLTEISNELSNYKNSRIELILIK